MTDTAVRSEILESELIVSFIIKGQSFDSWEPIDGTDLQRRTGRLTIEIERIRLGQLDQDKDAPFDLEIVQRAPASGRIADYYGLWSHAPTAVGFRLTGFCDGASTDARVALTDTHCQQLAPTADVEADLDAALTLEAKNPSPTEVLAEVERVKAACGGLFGRFVWARTHEWLETSEDAFSRLMAVAEDSATTTEARECYLSSAYEDATFTEALSESQQGRLARAMFRTGVEDQVGELRAHLLTIYLPNLVGDVTRPRLRNEAVFGGETALRDLVLTDAEAHPDHYSPALRAWLTGESS